jgi:hypothetical protein
MAGTLLSFLYHRNCLPPLDQDDEQIGTRPLIALVVVGVDL